MITNLVLADYGWSKGDGERSAWVAFSCDGYSTSADILQQVSLLVDSQALIAKPRQTTNAMDIVLTQYPVDEHVFAYDNAATPKTP